MTVAGLERSQGHTAFGPVHLVQALVAVHNVIISATAHHIVTSAAVATDPACLRTNFLAW